MKPGVARNVSRAVLLFLLAAFWPQVHAAGLDIAALIVVGLVAYFLVDDLSAAPGPGAEPQCPCFQHAADPMNTSHCELRELTDQVNLVYAPYSGGES